MLFDELQETLALWRLIEPTNIYLEDEWDTDDGWSLTVGYNGVTTSGGIYKAGFFRECYANIEIGITLSGDSSFILCAQDDAGLWQPLQDYAAVSGLNIITYALRGTTFYNGLGIIFNTGVKGVVSYVYLGDKTYATKDEGYLDAVWKFVQNISGRVEPVSSFAALRNQQTFSTASDRLYSPYDYRLVLMGGDAEVDSDGIQRKVLGQPEIYKGDFPHVEAVLERAQFEMTS